MNCGAPDTPPDTPPSRSPDAADLALAKIATPWAGLHIGGETKVAADLADIRSHTELAEALTAWLAARGIY
jgi:hypothetical protein